MFKPPKTKPPLEAKEEADFVKALKNCGVEFKVRKLNGLGYRSWPDRLVLGPECFMIMIELKRKETGKLSQGQSDLFDELFEIGHQVFVFDDGKEAAAFVMQRFEEHVR
jgi:hypothetical protein